jgi:cell fate regulator YaaT (PSP1 superfamily)
VAEVVSVVFRDGGKVYQFDAGGVDVAPGDDVVVDTARGADFGHVVRSSEQLAAEARAEGLKKVLRKATAADLRSIAAHKAIEQEAKAACGQLVAELGLAMKVISAAMSFDGGKVTISFFAEDRVDFRELALRLNDRLRRRVELKQVNAREGARMIGGYGPCGRRLCCNLFAGDQEPVSIRMAKDQSLPLNPAKISGCCGRLMCCLKYEHDVYVAFKKRAPKKGAIIATPAGEGKVVELLAPMESVAVDLGEGRMMTFKLAELSSGEEE